MNGQAYAEYLVILGVLVAALCVPIDGYTPVARLADAVRALYLSQVAAIAAPTLPLDCGDRDSTPAMMTASCR